MTPNTRRAIRTVVHAIGALAMLCFLAWIIHKLPSDKLLLLSLGLILILLIRELLHGAENVTARLKFKAGSDGISGELDSTKAARAVADAADEEAEKIEGAELNKGD